MGFFQRQQQKAPQEQSLEYQRRLVQEVLDYCGYLDNGVVPSNGQRYGGVFTVPGSFLRRVETALSDSTVPLPEAISRLLFYFYYVDEEVVSHLCYLQESREIERGGWRERVGQLLSTCSELEEQLRASRGTLSWAYAELTELRRQLGREEQTVERLAVELEKKEAHIREQNRIIAQQQEEITRLRK